MRKLGHGQSVVFCVPDEIQSQIRMSKSAPGDAALNTIDVVQWAIRETEADLQRKIPLWTVQGMRFLRQKGLWAKATRSSSISMSHKIAEKFIESEATTLSSRYQPTTDRIGASSLSSLSRKARKDPNVAAIQARCEEFNITDFSSSVLDAQQERELAVDVVQERFAEKPGNPEAAEHELHADVIDFVHTGKIRKGSLAFKSAFRSLKKTSAAQHLKLKQLPSDILVTVDFRRTVVWKDKKSARDHFQRPVQWILTSTEDNSVRLVIISPYEAQALMPHLERSKVHLHVYAAQPNPTIRSIDDLKLFMTPAVAENWELPRHLRLQLNLFAGQLYFKSFRDYQETCEMLGLAWKAPEEGATMGPDGFIGGPKSPLRTSPVMFLKTFLTKVRRDCDDISGTHWGRVLGGEILEEAEFEEDVEMVDV